MDRWCKCQQIDEEAEGKSVRRGVPVAGTAAGGSPVPDPGLECLTQNELQALSPRRRLQMVLPAFGIGTVDTIKPAIK